MSRQETAEVALFGFAGGVFGNLAVSAFFIWVQGNVADKSTLYFWSGVFAGIAFLGFFYIVYRLLRMSYWNEL